MRRIIALLLSLILILCTPGMMAFANSQEAITVSLSECDEIISGNPGKGWVRYSALSNGLSDEVMELVSVGYARFSWYEIEPNEGEYNWFLIDSALESWSARGKKFAFGIMSANTATTEEYVTPKWVFDAGAACTRMTSSDSADGMTAASGQYIPVWDDPVYLEKVSNLAKAIADRYDGDSRIAFIDIRSYGNYGETHLLRLESSGSRALDLDGEKKHIDAYADHFTKTKLIYPTANKSTHRDITAYAVERGVGLRYDGIMQDSTNGVLLKPAKDKNTAIFEFALPYANLKGNTAGGNRSWNANEYVAAFNRALPSYMDLGQYNDDSELFYKDNKKMVTSLANTMGYHFVLKQFELDSAFALGDAISISFDVENKGVTKLFEPGYASVAMLDANNNVVDKVWLENVNFSDAKAGEITTFTSKASLNNVAEGTYKLAFGLFWDETSAQPDYQFGNYGLANTNWYQIATVTKTGNRFKLEDPYAYVNGKSFAREFYNGKAYLPVRSCFEAIGGKVGWSAETGVTVNLEGTVFAMKNSGVYVNGATDSVGNFYINAQGVSYIEMDAFRNVRDFVYRIDAKTGSHIINTAKYEYTSKLESNTILNDGDFEAYSNAWSFNDSDFSYSNDKAFTGNTSLKVANRKVGAMASQTFTVSAGKEYEISFAVNDSAAVSYAITDSAEGILYSGTVPRGKGEWKEYSFKFGYTYSALEGSDITTKIIFTSEQDDSRSAYIDAVSLKTLGDIADSANGLFGDNGIETNRTKWQGRNGAAFLRSSENPHEGNLCGVITNRNGTWYGGMIDIYDALQENGPGTYKFEGWFRTAPGAGEMGITVYSFKLNNAIDITKVFKINEEWTYVTFESEITQAQYDSLYSAYTLIMGDPGDNHITKDIYFDDIYMTKISD